jgi:hypothetical protein
MFGNIHAIYTKNFIKLIEEKFYESYKTYKKISSMSLVLYNYSQS